MELSVRVWVFYGDASSNVFSVPHYRRSARHGGSECGGSRPPGQPPAYAGTDFVVAREGKIEEPVQVLRSGARLTRDSRTYPHGMSTTHGDQINADLLAFVQA